MKAYAILDGGGVKGAALAAALKAAQDRQIEFAGYGGTSAGSIVALLASMGFSGSELEKKFVCTRGLRFNRGERINLLAAALSASAGAHFFLSVLSLPKQLTVATPGVPGAALIALKLLWTLAALAASGYVIYNAISMFNARSLRKSKTAAYGAVLLPLIGFTGFITSFALVPAGVLAIVLLKKPLWMAAFDDVDRVQEFPADEPGPALVET